MDDAALDDPGRAVAARILVVEDDPILQKHLSMVLELQGHTLTAAVSSGAEAIRSVAADPPDLILMDVQLDGPMDGIATAEVLRRRWDGPIIYVTGRADHQTLGRANAVEPAAWLVKPFEQAGLDAAIHIAIGNHRRAQARQAWVEAAFQRLGPIDEATFAIDRDLRVRFANSAAEALTERGRERLIGRPLGAVLARQGMPVVEAVEEVVRHVLGGAPECLTTILSRRLFVAPLPAGPTPFGVILTISRVSAEPAGDLICVCSWCTRVRSSTESWLRFEQFFSQHHQVAFTHGICPDCSSELLRE